MTLYVNGELTALIIVVIIGVVLMCIGYALYEKFEFKYEVVSFLGAITSAVSGAIAGFAALFVVIFLIGSACQRHAEPINYQLNLELQRTLQQAIDNSEDVVNTDLYLKAVDFNSDLASVQAAQVDPRYSISFSGEVDWAQIPLIDLE